jgi:hypothetical protein
MLNEVVDLIQISQSGIPVNGYVPGYGLIDETWYLTDEEILYKLNILRKEVNLPKLKKLPISWKKGRGKYESRRNN